MPEDDAALRAMLTQIVLADLRAARSPLSPPAVAALRILSSSPGTTSPGTTAPTTTPSGKAPARPGWSSLRQAGVPARVGGGLAGGAGGGFFAPGRHAPPPPPPAGPAAGPPPGPA